MSNQIVNVPIRLLNTFIKTVQKIGADKTQTILDQSNKYNNVDALIMVQVIRNSVCKEFQISAFRLTEEKVKGELRADATRIFTFLLYEYLHYKRTDLVNNKIIVISHRLWGDNIAFIKNLDPKISCQRDLLLRIERIKEYISTEISNLEHKNLTINNNNHGKTK